MSDHCQTVHGTICPISEPANASAFRIAAHDLYVARGKSSLTDGDINVDEGAVVSESDEGAYVAAWVWVRASEADLPGPDDEDDEDDDDDDDEEDEEDEEDD
jgi:hypothetical protein